MQAFQRWRCRWSCCHFAVLKSLHKLLISMTCRSTPSSNMIYLHRKIDIYRQVNKYIIKYTFLCSSLSSEQNKKSAGKRERNWKQHSEHSQKHWKATEEVQLACCTVVQTEQILQASGYDVSLFILAIASHSPSKLEYCTEKQNTLLKKKRSFPRLHPSLFFHVDLL